MVLRKKAVSPIIATILLVVIALILVGILLSWGQNFILKSTSDADDAIDRKCIGAAVEITNCVFKDNNLSFIMINTGKIEFNKDTNFSVIIIDSENNLFVPSSEHEENFTNLLGNASPFTKGGSSQIKLDLGDEGKNLTEPIDVTVRNSLCPNNFTKTTCR